MSHHVYAGWTVPASQPALALFIDASDVSAGIDLPQSAGFSVRIETHPANPARSVVLLEAESEQYHEVFATLAEDVRNEISGAINEVALFAAFIARLHRWQHFLRRRRTTRLSRTEQIGLWGELWFLRSIIVPRLGRDAGVQAWGGPGGSNQDFEFDGQAVEVKTGAANPESRVHISNILQLVDHGLDNLYLRHFLVSTHQGAGLTLPDLILRLREELEESLSALQAFEVKLLEAGYLDSEADYYQRLGLAVVAANTYGVVNGFPRLLPGDLPPGVGEVRYVLSLGACEEFMLAPDPFAEEDSQDG